MSTLLACTLFIALCDDADRYLETQAGKLWYDVHGTGPCLVFLHDGLIPSPTWDAQIPEFARKFQTVRFDRRSHGRSEPPKQPHSNIDDLLALLNALKVDSATLVGSSSGGELALDFTLAHPERVSALVLEGPIVSGMGFSEHFRRRGLLNSRPWYQSNDAARTIENWANDMYLIDQRNAEARDRLRALLTAWPASATWQTTDGRPADRPAAGRLAEIHVPVLILVGSSDIPDVHAHCGAIESAVPKARRVVVPNAGHLVHLEQPELLNKLAAEFLRPAEVARRLHQELAAKSMHQQMRELLQYDKAASLDVQQIDSEQHGNVSVRDVSYSSAGGRVPAFLVVPDGEGPFAAVLWLHHGQGNRSTFLGEAIDLASHGVVSLLIDSPENRPENKNRNLKPFDPGPFRSEKIQTLIDLTRGIDLLCERDDVDRRRVAYVGHSLGSTLGGVLAGMEPRIKASVLMAGFSAESAVARTGHSRYGIAFRALLDDAQQREFISAIAPFDAIHYLPRATGPILFQFAERDEFIERWDAELALIAATGPKEVQWFDVDHWFDAAARQARDGWLIKTIGSATATP